MGVGMALTAIVGVVFLLPGGLFLLLSELCDVVLFLFGTRPALMLMLSAFCFASFMFFSVIPIVLLGVNSFSLLIASRSGGRSLVSLDVLLELGLLVFF